MPGNRQQLDRGRELAALLVDGADRSGIRLGDDEHRWSMGRRAADGNAVRGVSAMVYAFTGQEADEQQRHGKPLP
jgi:hypothetical protein